VSTSRYAVVGRRVCAVLAACSAVLHALMVEHAGNVVIAALIVAMAVACLYCARELWATGSLRIWCVVAVMNLAMVAVHWSMPGHHHGQPVSIGQVAPMSTLMVVATSVSVVEAAIATAVLWVQTRRRAITLTPQWNSAAARSSR
jgi:hypothetical protein